MILHIVHVACANGKLTKTINNIPKSSENQSKSMLEISIQKHRKLSKWNSKMEPESIKIDSKSNEGKI